MKWQDELQEIRNHLYSITAIPIDEGKAGYLNGVITLHIKSLDELLINNDESPSEEIERMVEDEAKRYSNQYDKGERRNIELACIHMANYFQQSILPLLLAEKDEKIKLSNDPFIAKHLERIKHLGFYYTLVHLMERQREECLDNLKKDGFYAKHKNDFPKSRILHAPTPKELEEWKEKLPSESQLSNGREEAIGWKAIAESNRDANESACKMVWSLTSEKKEMYKKILAARDAYIAGNMDEVWHQLYFIASPNFDKYEPGVWEDMEKYVMDAQEGDATAAASSTEARTINVSLCTKPFTENQGKIENV